MVNEKRDKPTYIMVSRKMINTWMFTTVILTITVLASFQYTNYVDRRSNGHICTLVTVFDDTYRQHPPPSDIGQRLAYEIAQIQTAFKCE